MAERLLPEAIRGSWYLLADEGTPREAIEDKGQLLAFGLDGNFVRYDISKKGKRTEKERGDYTFDGDFLIVRGRNTETYRVDARAEYMWELEAKKKQRRLYRGLIEDKDFFELGDEERRQLGMLPVRVRIEARFGEDADAIFELVYTDDDDHSRRVGCFSVDTFGGELWVGLVALATDVQADSWHKVIEKSFLAPRADDFGEVEQLTLEILGA